MYALDTLCDRDTTDHAAWRILRCHTHISFWNLSFITTYYMWIETMLLVSRERGRSGTGTWSGRNTPYSSEP